MIDDLPTVAEVIERIVKEAEATPGPAGFLTRFDPSHDYGWLDRLRMRKARQMGPYESRLARPSRSGDTDRQLFARKVSHQSCQLKKTS